MKKMLEITDSMNYAKIAKSFTITPINLPPGPPIKYPTA